ncbi:hypothetical protein KL905_004215 [Ogataea polymorpha]|uniref:uncharacterized protein n=1 Tax=Ogataea polymorpha TaxID=460523 RepID=UPI0007F4DE6A|nr:uncharacterized protein OGAPODRAFT_48167 [Ogataea polymorpha]KAG7878443.1 hypothetical protein KL937_003685 [Ogataea polymorpha]KAG7918136.1 hypothetical protein KL905_004215 [Ogataea polymorpha]KAG7933760.1 hypothetical protein KL904_004020 [Ogataea polymorpha]OBA16875.1 hypothetical protein OGAPODRAFT_48167 [Ogataea polymorpha]
MESHYTVLGVDTTASVAQIKEAYRRKLLSLHPDKTGTQTHGNEISRIADAYRVLVDPIKRQEYDTTRQEELSRLGIATGDGLDTVSLDDFKIIDTEHELRWTKSCPRCTYPGGFELNEADLDKGTVLENGQYELIIQCSSCSLWLVVKYAEETDC